MQKGRLLSGGLTDGYKIIRYSIREDGKVKYKYNFFYKLVAEVFLQKETDDQTFVLHLDYVRDNDDIKNLKFASNFNYQLTSFIFLHRRWHPAWLLFPSRPLGLQGSWEEEISTKGHP